MNNSIENALDRNRIKKLSWISISILFVSLLYLWFISSGHWTNWRNTTDYYSLLADGFSHGQLALMVKPDPRLLSLPNPYDPNERSGIDYPIDVSLYRNNYYLYFGPVPGLLIAALRGFFPQGIGDQYLVFVFTLGIFIFQSLILLAIQETFFKGLPIWAIILGIILTGLLGPFTRLLVHPDIYEAALAGGQFFFTLGLYFTFLALRSHPVKTRWLLIGSVCFVGSAGSRIMQVLPIGFIGLMTLIFLIVEFQRSKSLSAMIRGLTSFFVPLTLGGALLAWYNWARFGSILEFGYYYQLAYNLQSFYHTLFLPGYLAQNIYNYVLNPFTVGRIFPFINPLPGNKSPVIPFYFLPQPYIVDGFITGLLFGSPFILFALLPIFILILKGIRIFIFKVKIESQPESSFYDWILLSLAGSFLIAALPILLFFYAATRYEVDFFSALAILAVIGFWQVYSDLGKKAIRQKLFAILGVSIAIISMVLNTMIAYASHLTWFALN